MNDIARPAYRYQQSILQSPSAEADWILHEQFAARVNEASRRYTRDRSPSNRSEYLKALRAFTDLVVRHKEPGSF